MLIPLSSSAPRMDARIRAAWHMQLAAAGKSLGLLAQLVRHCHELLPRFASAYHRLQRLPRRVRREEGDWTEELRAAEASV